MSDSAKYRLLGNAVWPQVIEWIGRAIARAIKEAQESLAVDTVFERFREKAGLEEQHASD